MGRSTVLMQTFAGCVVIMLSGCGKHEVPVDTTMQTATQTPPTASCTADNTNKPQWVYRNSGQVAVVFVHGIFGDTLNTWKNGQCHALFDYLHERPDIGKYLDIYAFGYASNWISSGSLNIGEAANKLNTYLEDSGVAKYDQIVFVAHSMGGLITMRELISHPDIAKKTQLIFFYATPQEGSDITNIARYVVDNPAIKQMLPADGNTYLQQLNEDWLRVRNAVPRPAMACAYETMPTKGPVKVVPWSSSTRNCDAPGEAIENTNHLSIVKPNSADDQSVIVLANAINKYVMPTLDPKSWATPEFPQENDHWTYTLKDINGRNPASIKNQGQVWQRYSIELVDADDMSMSPEDMPRYIPPGGSDVVRLVLVNDPQREYRLKLKLGLSPERIVIARINDLDAATAERNARKQVASQGIEAYFASTENREQFQLLSASDQEKKLADVASQAIAQENPDLPASTRSLVAADTLASLSLSNAAGAALADMEQHYPETAKTRSAQRIAAVVTAQSGKPDVLRTVTVPALPIAQATQPADLSQATDEQKTSIAKLADVLSTVPSMQSEGLILKGDVLRANGESAAAKQAYSQARAVKVTPTTVARTRQGVEL
jgi:pimeloyl-ACP methyl ester carboxylesterase